MTIAYRRCAHAFALATALSVATQASAEPPHTQPAGPPPDPDVVVAPAPDGARGNLAPRNPLDVSDVIKDYQDLRAAGVGGAQAGLGPESGVATLVQDVAQVVLDLAADRSFEFARARLNGWLKCQATPQPALQFKQTCALIEELSLNTLAKLPKSLRDALAMDLFEHVRVKLPLDSSGSASALSALMQNVSSVLGATMQDSSMLGDQHADALVSLLVQKLITAEGENLPKEVRVGIAALLKCELAGMAQCDVTRNALELRDRGSALDAAQQRSALVIATHLMSARALMLDTHEAQSLGRVKHAVQAWVEIAVAITKQSCAGGCDAAGNEARIRSAGHGLLAILDRNNGDAIMALRDFLDADPDQKRALRILVRMVQIAQAKPGEERQGAIRELASAFTARTDRGGDAIASLGGTLALAVGDRVGHGQSALYAPVALSLGLAVQRLPEDPQHLGWLVSLSAFDLGQYVTFQQGLKVRSPELADIVSPALTLALSYGYELPFIIGLSGGYAPNYTFKAGGRGAAYAGLIAGVHVPLLDLN
jgi:hypothetical protein